MTTLRSEELSADLREVLRVKSSSIKWRLLNKKKPSENLNNELNDYLNINLIIFVILYPFNQSSNLHKYLLLSKIKLSLL